MSANEVFELKADMLEYMRRMDNSELMGVIELGEYVNDHNLSRHAYVVLRERDAI